MRGDDYTRDEKGRTEPFDMLSRVYSRTRVYSRIYVRDRQREAVEDNYCTSRRHRRGRVMNGCIYTHARVRRERGVSVPITTRLLLARSRGVCVCISGYDGRVDREVIADFFRWAFLFLTRVCEICCCCLQGIIV